LNALFRLFGKLYIFFNQTGIHHRTHIVTGRCQLVNEILRDAYWYSDLRGYVPVGQRPFDELSSN